MTDKFEDYCWKDIVSDELLEIYSAYRREVYVGRRPALLAIDLYNKAYLGGNRPVIEVNREFSGSCGESTSGCVRASTVDAYSYGFHNVLVEECAYDRSMLSHKVNLFDLHHKYADVMHVGEVIAHLDGMATGAKAAE